MSSKDNNNVEKAFQDLYEMLSDPKKKEILLGDMTQEKDNITPFLNENDVVQVKTMDERMQKSLSNVSLKEAREQRKKEEEQARIKK